MNGDNSTRGATTPWRGPAHYRDLGKFLCEAVAAGLIGSLALALAVLVATTTPPQATGADIAPHAGQEAPPAVAAGARA